MLEKNKKKLPLVFGACSNTETNNYGNWKKNLNYVMSFMNDHSLHPPSKNEFQKLKLVEEYEHGNFAKFSKSRL
jgi:hypothetical protein